MPLNVQCNIENVSYKVFEYHYKHCPNLCRLADTLTSVAVLVSIDNWTKWNLSEPENEMNSGVVIGELPENIAPGQSEMAMFGKDVSAKIIRIDIWLPS